jgi:hypothetical protein
LDLRGRKCWEAGKDCIMRSFITCIDSPSVIRVIKSRRVRWAGHVAHMGEMRSGYKILVRYRYPEGRSHMEGLGIDGNIILKWILGK